MSTNKIEIGSVVCLNEIGDQELGSMNREYLTDFTECLLAGESFTVTNIVPVIDGSKYWSLHFERGAYSYSKNYFQTKT